MSIYPIGVGVVFVGTPPVFSALLVRFASWKYPLHFLCNSLIFSVLQFALHVRVLVPYIVSCAWVVRFWKKGKPPYNCTVFKRGDNEL